MIHHYSIECNGFIYSGFFEYNDAVKFAKNKLPAGFSYRIYPVVIRHKKAG